MKPALLSLALLAGCTSLVPSTVARLATIDPMQINPGVLQVAVVMPAGMRPQPGKATFTVEGTRGDTGERAMHQAALIEQQVTLAGVALEPGDTAYLFQLSESDVAAMRALQAQFASWSAEAPGASEGKMSVGMEACTTGTGPVPGAEGAIFIRANEAGPLLPLIARTSIEGLIGADAMASIGPCNAAQ